MVLPNSTINKYEKKEYEFMNITSELEKLKKEKLAIEKEYEAAMEKQELEKLAMKNEHKAALEKEKSAMKKEYEAALEKRELEKLATKNEHKAAMEKEKSSMKKAYKAAMKKKELEFSHTMKGMSTKYQKDTEELRNTTNTTTASEMVSPILEKWMAQASQLALTLSTWHTLHPVPSVKKPFVFFHLRKAGGSSIRHILYQSATHQNSTPLSNWIPCSNPNDPCMTFSLPPTIKREKKAIYASHVNYAHMTQLLRELRTGAVPTSTLTVHDKNYTFHSMTDEDTLREKSFGTCLTNIRPTVGRVRSCWDYRFVEKGAKSWTLPTAANMSAAEWKVLLPMAIDKYGTGCNNEMARAFGSTPYEHAVNHFSVETEGTKHFLTELEHVLSRMAGCVMVRMDRCEDSSTILQHYLPWVQGDICSKGGHVKIGLSKVKNGSDLTTEAQEEILSQNKFDDFVFEFAAKLFEEQLRVATNSTVVRRGN